MLKYITFFFETIYDYANAWIEYENERNTFDSDDI